MAEKLISIANRFKTPISISALVVIVLYLIYHQILELEIFSKLDEDQTFNLINNLIYILFYLAILAIVLGVAVIALTIALYIIFW